MTGAIKPESLFEDEKDHRERQNSLFSEQTLESAAPEEAVGTPA